MGRVLQGLLARINSLLVLPVTGPASGPQNLLLVWIQFGLDHCGQVALPPDLIWHESLKRLHKSGVALPFRDLHQPTRKITYFAPLAQLFFLQHNLK